MVVKRVGVSQRLDSGSGNGGTIRSPLQFAHRFTAHAQAAAAGVPFTMAL